MAQRDSAAAINDTMRTMLIITYYVFMCATRTLFPRYYGQHLFSRSTKTLLCVVRNKQQKKKKLGTSAMNNASENPAN